MLENRSACLCEEDFLAIGFLSFRGEGRIEEEIFQVISLRTQVNSLRTRLSQVEQEAREARFQNGRLEQQVNEQPVAHYLEFQPGGGEGEEGGGSGHTSK